MTDRSTQERTLVFDFPLPRTHTGVALGNGSFGALVWAKDLNCLQITVSRNDFWDHRNGGQLLEGGTWERLLEAYNSGNSQAMRDVLSPGVRKLWQAGVRPSTLLPGGRFELRLLPGAALERAILDCLTGGLVIQVKGRPDTLTLTMGADRGAYRDVLWIQDPGGLIGEVLARPAWQWVEDEFRHRGFTPPISLTDATAGLYGWIQACPEDPALCALMKKVEDGYALAVMLGDTLSESAHECTARAMDAIAAWERWSEGLLNQTAAWWTHYWARVPEAQIPAPFFSRFLCYAHWKYGCATNPNAALPAPLQGPWVEEYQFPPWGGDYTFNVNIQQIYTLTFNGYNLAHILPLFDMLESAPFQETMRHNARVLLGIDDGLLLTHTVNDRGRQCQIGFSPHSALDQAVAAWLGHLYWLYYRHTGDEGFLQERAYPFMRGVMRVYEAMLEERGDGALWLPLSVSPEYGVTGFGQHLQSGPNASMQLACIHTLTNALLEASEILDLPPCPTWHEIKARLPLFATMPDPRGNQRIAIWEGQDLDVCHRHHSHLASVYPFDLTAEMTQEERACVDNAIEHWIKMGMGAWSEWCFPWAAIIEARMGMREAPLVLLKIWKEVFINEGLTTVYLPRFHGVTGHRYDDINKPKETHEVMQLEGTAAGATAIWEMLIHTHGGVTKVFPATPSAWKDVSFRDAPQPGSFRVSAIRKNGRTGEIKIQCQRAGILVLDVPDRQTMTLLRGESQEQISLPLELRMEAGETISLR